MVQPSLQPPGGGSGVAAWMLQALRDDYDLTVLTWEPCDLDAVNRFYGTSLRSAEVATRDVSPLLRRAVDAIPLPLDLLKTAILLRRCKRMAAPYDVVLSASNEMDFGRPGIQYVHFPWGFQPPRVDARWYQPRVLPSVYHRLCVALAGFSVPSMQRNVTLANSRWTAAMVTRRHGIEARTLHPPVAAGVSEMEWAARDNGFLCVGRFAPEKHIERVIAILAQVRQRVPDVHLHVVGTPGPRRYYRRLRRLVDDHASWVFLDENLARPDLARLMAGHRYGLHGMDEEHFGIGIAEMVRAGCIVWVPSGGGQVEIVGDDRLLYDSIAAAAAAIVRTLTDPAEQAALRAHLATRAALFSVERFTREFRAVVAEVCAGC
jgi:glycosyltransferase involved in cell wall biosynthesis